VRALSAPENRVVGIDLAPSAIRRAQAHALVARESYLLADLFALPAEMAGRFDLVFEHTCFCAINPTRRKEYVETVVNLLKPNGALLAIFFLDPDHDEAGPPFRVSRDELEAFFGSYFGVQEEWVPEHTFPGREGRELMRLLVRRGAERKIASSG
jgi:SAM-dependent methyltransferase